MYQIQLLNDQTFRANARIVDLNIEWEELILPIVLECQRNDIKSQIGDFLYIKLMEYVNMQEDEQTDEVVNILLNGGVYEAECGDGCRKNELSGLRKALAYYVWADMIEAGTVYIGRNGARQSQDTTSSMADYASRKNVYSTTRKTADNFMLDVMKYVHAKREELGIKCCNSSRRNKVFKVIGD